VLFFNRQPSAPCQTDLIGRPLGQINVQLTPTPPDGFDIQAGDLAEEFITAMPDFL